MTEKTNFLVIMSDQHSPEAIGALGHPVVKTPALDALAAAGVSFTSAYCAYPMCTPARASFMTGLLTPQHGVWDLGSPLAQDCPRGRTRCVQRGTEQLSADACISSGRTRCTVSSAGCAPE